MTIACVKKAGRSKVSQQQVVGVKVNNSGKIKENLEGMKVFI